MIRAAWSSVAVFAIAPLQDLLSLDNRARMNYPGSLGGNWSWRVDPEAFNEFLRSRLNDANLVYGRLNPLSVRPDNEEENFADDKKAAAN